MKKKSKKITHEMVVTHNDFNNLSLAHFSPNENKILHAIVSKIKNKDTERVTITFDEIKRLTQYKRNDNRAFLASIEEVNKKLMQLNFRLRRMRCWKVDYRKIEIILPCEILFPHCS